MRHVVLHGHKQPRPPGHPLVEARLGARPPCAARPRAAALAGPRRPPAAPLGLPRLPGRRPGASSAFSLSRRYSAEPRARRHHRTSLAMASRGTRPQGSSQRIAFSRSGMGDVAGRRPAPSRGRPGSSRTRDSSPAVDLAVTRSARCSSSSSPRTAMPLSPGRFASAETATSAPLRSSMRSTYSSCQAHFGAVGPVRGTAARSLKAPRRCRPPPGRFRAPAAAEVGDEQPAGDVLLEARGWSGRPAHEPGGERSSGEHPDPLVHLRPVHQPVIVDERDGRQPGPARGPAATGTCLPSTTSTRPRGAGRPPGAGTRRRCSPGPDALGTSGGERRGRATTSAAGGGARRARRAWSPPAGESRWSTPPRAVPRLRRCDTALRHTSLRSPRGGAVHVDDAQQAHAHRIAGRWTSPRTSSRPTTSAGSTKTRSTATSPRP